MRLFLIALGFLTRLPVRLRTAPTDRETAMSARAYPLVGLLLGLSLAGAYLLLREQTALGVFFRGAALVVLEAGLTGGLHLDGLMDAADGLSGPWPRERALVIMKDSRVGAHGALAACGLLLLKTGAAASLRTPAQALILAAMPCYARWTALLLAVIYPHAGEKGGPGGAVVGVAGSRELAGGFLAVALATGGAVLAAASPLLGAVSCGRALLVFGGLWALATLVGTAVAGAARRRLGGITGDVVGAAIELSELAVLTAGAACWR